MFKFFILFLTPLSVFALPFGDHYVALKLFDGMGTGEQGYSEIFACLKRHPALEREAIKDLKFDMGSLRKYVNFQDDCSKSYSTKGPFCRCFQAGLGDLGVQYLESLNREKEKVKKEFKEYQVFSRSGEKEHEELAKGFKNFFVDFFEKEKAREEKGDVTCSSSINSLLKERPLYSYIITESLRMEGRVLEGDRLEESCSESTIQFVALREALNNKIDGQISLDKYLLHANSYEKDSEEFLGSLMKLENFKNYLRRKGQFSEDILDFAVDSFYCSERKSVLDISKAISKVPPHEMKKVLASIRKVEEAKMSYDKLVQKSLTLNAKMNSKDLSEKERKQTLKEMEKLGIDLALSFETLEARKKEAENNLKKINQALPNSVAKLTLEDIKTYGKKDEVKGISKKIAKRKSRSLRGINVTNSLLSGLSKSSSRGVKRREESTVVSKVGGGVTSFNDTLERALESRSSQDESVVPPVNFDPVSTINTPKISNESSIRDNYSNPKERQRERRISNMLNRLENIDQEKIANVDKEDSSKTESELLSIIDDLKKEISSLKKKVDESKETLESDEQNPSNNELERSVSEQRYSSSPSRFQGNNPREVASVSSVSQSSADSTSSFSTPSSYASPSKSEASESEGYIDSQISFIQKMNTMPRTSELLTFTAIDGDSLKNLDVVTVDPSYELWDDKRKGEYLQSLVAGKGSVYIKIKDKGVFKVEENKSDITEKKRNITRLTNLKTEADLQRKRLVGLLSLFKGD